MKKSVIAVVMSVLFVSLFTSVYSKESDPDEVYDLMIKTYEAARNPAYANVENAIKALFYTDVKMPQKYRLKAVLTNLENDDLPDFRDDVTRSFSDGATMDPEGFFSLVGSYYRDSHDEAEKTEPKVPRPDTDRVSRLLFCSLSDKYASSADGSLWMYSSNYFVSFPQRQPRYIFRSCEGMRKKDSIPDAEGIVRRSGVLEGAVTSGVVSDDGAYVATRVSGRDGEVTVVAYRGLSSPLVFDFSLCGKNQ